MSRDNLPWHRCLPGETPAEASVRLRNEQIAKAQVPPREQPDNVLNQATLPITFPPTERTVVRIVTPEQAQVVDHMKGHCHQGRGCLICEQAEIIVDLKRRLDSIIEGS